MRFYEFSLRKDPALIQLLLNLRDIEMIFFCRFLSPTAAGLRTKSVLVFRELVEGVSKERQIRLLDSIKPLSGHTHMDDQKVWKKKTIPFSHTTTSNERGIK